MSKDNKSQQLDKKGKQTLLALLTTKTKTAAAKKLDINRTTLYDRIDKYGLDGFIEQIPSRALQTLQIGSVRAAEKLVDGIDDQDHNLAYDNAKDVLDRVGVTKKEGPKVAVQANASDMKVEFIKGES